MVVNSQKKNMNKEVPVMLNKKILMVTLLSTMGLVACGGEVQAKPTNYNDPLISFSDSKDEIYHNLVSIIEDAYRDGSLASAVLDKILYQYSVSVFGRYNRVANPKNLGDSEITLSEAVESFKTGDGSKGRQFVDSHKAYWTTNSDGERITTDDAKESEKNRVLSKWDTIEERIAKTFYDAIKGGSYNNKRGYFDEEKYMAELRSQLKKVVAKDKQTVYTEEDKKLITPDVEEKDVFDETKGYLHRSNYQNGETATYVEDEVVPEIYRNLLVEQYLLDESYNTLGRSYARKVNVLTISANSNNDKAASALTRYFVRNIINVKRTEKITLDDFKAVSNAYKGVTAEAHAYLEAVNAAYPGSFPLKAFKGYPTFNDESTYAYYSGTDYGDMMAKFEKITQSIFTTDASIESDFTGTYTYDALVGKEIKENGIKSAAGSVTEGWYIKNGGLADLPDTIKSRLFNIGVANTLDNKSTVDRWAGDTYAVPANESKLVAKINGSFFLKVASKEGTAPDTDDILFYEGGKYYVVQIEEAVSGSKLAKGVPAEEEKYESKTKEDIINHIAHVVADNDTYQSASKKHWLEQAAIKYHDTKVYDYFKENYPDLFK